MTCAKHRVVACLWGKSGKRYFGENLCDTPVQVCPRAVGEGYEKCKSICHQSMHAEISALQQAGNDARGGEILIIGHDHACDACLDALAAAGVATIRFCP